MAQGRYQFEGQRVEQPSAGVGNVDLGALYSSFRGIDRSAWQTQDEKIQLDVLKGASPQTGFNRYMDLASVAGAAGDNLASITFQQKAYSLLNAGRGGGGGGGGGGGSGSGSSGVKASLTDAVSGLKENLLPQLQDEIKQIAEAIKSGVVPPAEGLNDIATSVATYQAKAQELYAEYSQYLGKKGFSGIKSDLNALAKEASIGFGVNDGDGSKSVNKALQESLYGNTVADGDYISQLSEDFTKLTGPEGANYVMAFVPQTAEGGLANKLSPNSTKQNGIVFTNKDLAESAGLRPIKRLLGDGNTVTVYVNPSSTDTNLGVDQLLVPTFDPATGQTINRNLQYNAGDTSFSEGGKPLNPNFVITGKETSSTDVPFPGASIDETQTQDQGGGLLSNILRGAKRATENPSDLFKAIFSGSSPQNNLQASLLGATGGLLGRLQNPQEQPTMATGPQPMTETPINALPTTNNPLTTYINNSLLSRVTTRPTTLQAPQRDFNDVLNALTNRNQPQRGPVAEGPQNPFSRITQGVGGYANIRPISRAQEVKQNPLGIRQQATMAALNGFKAFSRFIKGLF